MVEFNWQQFKNVENTIFEICVRDRHKVKKKYTSDYPKRSYSEINIVKYSFSEKSICFT